MILNRQRAVRVARQPLEAFLRRVREELDLGESDLTICFVSDAEIARMNEAFRKKKGPTDVLSFPAQKKRDAASAAKRLTRRTQRTQKPRKGRGKQDSRTAETYLGDIAIAPETARRYAKKEWAKFEQ